MTQDTKAPIDRESVERPWPIGLYAPGSYACTCAKCGKHHIADKRAQHCADCTLLALRAALDEAEAERSDAEKQAKEYHRWLGELLAVVHRDGGHDLHENGPEASVRSAHEKWADTMAALDEAEARADRAATIANGALDPTNREVVLRAELARVRDILRGRHDG